MEKFTAGEEVTLTTQGRPVRVLFGPYEALMGRGQDTYLVELMNGPDQGSGITVRGTALKRGPKFTVGEDVLVGTLETPATIVAGSFKGRAGSFYVLAYASGTHEASAEDRLKKVPTPSQTRDFWLAGTHYDLDATYVDADGDAWTFNGRRGEGGIPLMDCQFSGSDYQGRSLRDVVNEFGPLRKRI